MRTGGPGGGGGKRAPGKEDKIEKRDDSRGRGRLSVIGIGPGSLADMTIRARQAIESSDTIVGYTTYVKLIEGLIGGREVVSTGMMKEAERCILAVRLAGEGRKVALVSSGDAGIYGMAGLVLEVINEQGPGAGDVVPDGLPFDFEVVPGVPAVCSAAAALGAPLMHDFAAVSLSDLLTPWELIVRRIEAAASADFVIALYNPRSKGRPDYLEQAREIISRHRPGITPVGIVKDSTREGEKVTVTTLAAMPVEEVDMTSMVIVGNSKSYIFMDYIVTPRGYRGKRI